MNILLSQCLKTIIGDDNPPVTSIAFTPNSHFLLVSTLDSRMRLWDYTQPGSTAEVVKTYTGHTNTKYCCFSTFVTTGAFYYFYYTI